MNLSNHPIQGSIHFIQRNDNSFKNDIWNELSQGLWREFDISSSLYNNSLSTNQKHLQRPLFQDFLQVEAGVIFDERHQQTRLDIYHPKFTSASFDKFIEVAESFFKSLNAKRIGVHLSGGLDSSIIIGLLNYLKIPFVPIGMFSNTFEFRTERSIQEELICWGQDGLLINFEEYPLYSNLIDMPKHQIPTQIFNCFGVSRALSNEFSKRGCDVVLTGQGGDSLFVSKIDNLGEVSFNIGDEFINGDENDLVYQPRGMRLISFYSSPMIIDLISCARLGQNFDPGKRWARKWMKPILIPKLTEYTYYADFFYNPQIQKSGGNETKGWKLDENRAESQFQAVIEKRIKKIEKSAGSSENPTLFYCNLCYVVEHYVRVT